jgi:DNA-binding CsgD family transcriptional regulator
MISAKVAAIKELCCLGLDDRTFVMTLLSELHGVVPSLANTYVWLDSHNQVTDLYDESPEAWRLVPLYLQEFVNNREREAVPAMSELAARTSGVITTAQVATKEFYRSAFYNEILRPSDHHHAAAVVIRDYDRPYGVLLLNRGEQESEYATAELKLIEELLPFIAHGFATAGAVRFPLVENGDVGLLILDHCGAVRHVSPRARQLLFLHACATPNSPADARKGAPTVPAEVVWLCKKLQAVSHGSRRDVAPPVWRHENMWGRFAFRAHWLDPVARADSALIGISIHHQTPLPCRLWRQAKQLGLSPKQLRVCSLLAAGFSYDKIAEHMNVTNHTVTDHVRKLFEKLRVESRTELVQRVLSA